MNLRKVALGGLAAALLPAVGFSIYLRFRNVNGCSEGDQIANALAEQRVVVWRIDAASRHLCESYRELLAALQNAKKYTSLCGSLGVSLKYGRGVGDFPQLSAESVFYARLIDEKCSPR